MNDKSEKATLDKIDEEIERLKKTSNLEQQKSEIKINPDKYKELDLPENRK